MSWPKTLAKTSPRQADLALLVLRLWFGTVLALGHGMGKILNLGAFIDNVAKRVPLPEVLGPAVSPGGDVVHVDLGPWVRRDLGR